MDEFTQNIKNWVHYDNELKKHNTIVKELRLKKSYIQSILLENPSHDKINISDGRLQFSQTTVQQPLTLHLISSSLAELIRQPDQVNQIMDHIKNNRQKRTDHTIKRFYNK